MVANLEDNGKVVCCPVHIGRRNAEFLQSFSRAVATRGRGAHGITTPNGPDALFSQVN